MLAATIDQPAGGAAIGVQVPGYALAGAGGAENIPTEGNYQVGETIASFVGFGPVSDPRFVIVVQLTAPVGASPDLAAPVFGVIARQLLTYYQIPPTTGGGAGQ
jgi:cell division protein FtsI/penicillin-binding protein 2